jgi:hypothetical protein
MVLWSKLAVLKELQMERKMAALLGLVLMTEPEMDYVKESL